MRLKKLKETMTTQTLSGTMNAVTSKPAKNTSKSSSKNSRQGSNKYRGLIIAISLFLLFNLLVLGLNFYTSQGLDNDAVSINLAGRQRMLSQRMTKVILGMQYDAAQGRYNVESTAELKKVVSLFDGTLNGFKNGGTVVGGNEKPVYLPAVKTAAEKKLVNDALAIWQPYQKLLQPLTKDLIVNEWDLDQATEYARSNNLKLLKLMNDLTTSLETSTKRKSSQLQLIQTVALILSLILFANIIFNALRKLRSADLETTKAQRETSEILNTVKEGLFLLDPNLNIGQQHSNSLAHILQHPISADMPFFPLLENLVSADTYSSAKDYIQLLFGNRVKESLVQSLNPLLEVKIQDLHGDRYLNFQFNRVMQDKEVLHLLVTVQDITKQTIQAQELGAIKSQPSISLEMLTSLMQADYFQLKRFIANTEDSFVQINQMISEFSKHSSTSMPERINKCFRLIHSIKGEAATLNMQTLQNHAHQFETLLVDLRNKTDWSNEDYLKPVIILNNLFDDIRQIGSILDSIHHFLGDISQQKTNKQLSTIICSNLNNLAMQVSNNQQKEVLLQCELNLLDSLNEDMVVQIQQISIQLIRNGICHGIEAPEVRLQAGKAAQGLIHVSASVEKDSMIKIAVRDDGQGIVPERIRAAMLQSGRYSVEEVAALSDQQIVNKLFEPGFSTSANVSADAGHGVGMDVVQMKVQEMGGTLNISSKPDKFTQFTLLIPYHPQ